MNRASIFQQGKPDNNFPSGNRVLQRKGDFGNRELVRSENGLRELTDNNSNLKSGAKDAAENRTGLSDSLKGGLESLSGMDLSGVRVHRNSSEPARVNALAYTQGQDIHVGSGQEKHIPHEGWHVVQQMQGRVTPTIQTKGVLVNDDKGLEREADVMGEKATVHHPSKSIKYSPVISAASKLQPDQNQNSLSILSGKRSHSLVRQLRRIPPNVEELLTSASGGNAANFSANQEGALRLIRRAMAELTPAQRASVRSRRRVGGLTQAQYNNLPRRERRIRTAQAIISLFSSLELGDSLLLDAGPRPLPSTDSANIAQIAAIANALLISIEFSLFDGWLEQIFGSGNIASAKTKYANARTRMNELVALNQVVTDRGSGFSAEVSEDGLTDEDQISVSPSTIDNPGDTDSIVTFIHESMHAGNTGITDDVYITAPGFTTQGSVEKLNNAAHFEVIIWRMIDPTHANAFPVAPATSPRTFQTFIPAGTTVGGVTAPARTTSEEAGVAAYSLVREAWALGLNLHRCYIDLLRTPTDWTVPQPDFGGMVYENSIPFWSKVQKLTIHNKTVIDPASADISKHPVSQIDIALSEGLTRKLARGMDVLDPLGTNAQVLAFENSNSTSAERSSIFPGGSHTNVGVERDFLLKLTVRHPTVRPLTGSVSRDTRVVKKQGDPSLNLWSDILQPRNPNSFPN